MLDSEGLVEPGFEELNRLFCSRVIVSIVFELKEAAWSGYLVGVDL